MKSRFGSDLRWRALRTALLISALIAPPAFGWQGTVTAPKAGAALSAAEREAVARLKLETLREVTTALAAPDMEGRGTGQPGGDKAAKYLADRFAKLGLKPLGDAGTYLQAIKFKGAAVLPESNIKAGEATLKLGADFIATPPYTAEQIDASGSLVFISYGVVSSDLKRDDFAGLDVKGKVVVLLSGRPKNVDEATWAKAANNQALVMSLITKGAAGLVITNVGSAQQPYSMIASYLTRRRVSLAAAPEPGFKLPPIIIASDAGAEKLFAGSGLTFAQAKEKAEAGEAVSRDLGKTAAITVRVKKEEGTSSNVVAVLEGADAKLKEQAVVYTAHYDAYGIDAEGRIYPGAADNALGTASIVAIAEAFAKAPARPRRSVIFLAVTGEEYGLLGAEHWVKHPTWPIDKLAADLNYDGIGTEVYGPVKKVVGFGMEHSDLGPVLEAVVTATGGAITPDPMPEEKAFYRSDHYAFVKKGVPALMLMGGPDIDTAAFVARIKKWLDADYHQPTDTVRPDWNWEGPRTLAVVGLLVGMRVANADAMPAWLPSSPFNRARGTNEPAPPMQ